MLGSRARKLPQMPLTEGPLIGPDTGLEAHASDAEPAWTSGPPSNCPTP